MPLDRRTRLLLIRSAAVGAGIVIGLRALWGAWELPPDQFWSWTFITVLGVLALAALAALPVLVLVLARRALRGGARSERPGPDDPD